MDFIVIKFCEILCKILSRLNPDKLDCIGNLTLKYNKGVLKKLTKRYKVILITGTNGKRTTGTILAKILEQSGRHAIYNSNFSDNIKGITSFFLYHQSDKKKDIAIVEIDESNVHRYTRTAKAEYIICTNIFKNQLARYGEVYNTLKKVIDGIKNEPDIKMILNGDEPFLGNIEGNRIYYGFKRGVSDDKIREEKSNVEGQFCIKCHTKYKYDFYTYNHLGKYQCPNCGYKRPEIKYLVSNIDVSSTNKVSFTINETMKIFADIGGIHNVYNVLAAVSTSLEIGIEKEVILRAIKGFIGEIDQIHVTQISGKKVNIILTKNPAAYNEIIMVPFYNHKSKSVAFLLNDYYEDGKDISWIWDVDFENSVTNYDKIYISGTKKYDMAVRLKIAGYDSRKITVCNTIDNVMERLKKSGTHEEVYIFATPTAYDNVNKILQEQKIIYYS